MTRMVRLAAPTLFLALLPAALPARATAGPAAASVAASVAVVSDYRFRGVSRSGGHPVLQGELNVAGGDGWFAGAFASSLAGAGGGHVEIDLSGGRTKRFALFDATLGGTAYFWPGSGERAAAELFASAAVPLGPARAAVGAAWSPAGNGPTRSGRYLFAELSTAIPHTPLSVTTAVGHETVRAVDADGRPRTDKRDWRLGLDYHRGRLTIGAGYVGSNLGPAPVRFGGGFMSRGGGTLLVRARATF